VNGAATFRVSYEEIERAYAETGADERRQIGKVEELACGFGGGAGAFAAMGRAYGVYMSDGEMSGAVKAWRRANPWAQPWWNALEEAYLRAMRNPGREFSAGRVAYLYDGTHLWWVLPSGRVLCYPHARLEAGEVTYAKCSWKPAADAAEWPRARLWKGLACENVTQAYAQDLLRWARRQRDDVVLHVHDELVFEVPEGSADEAAAQVLALMRQGPPSSAGLPLDAQVKVMSRYGKG
jgi:DNA polymerase